MVAPHRHHRSPPGGARPPDSTWRCELCGCSSIETELRSWHPGTLGPHSLCCSCSRLAARAAKLSRRRARRSLPVQGKPSNRPVQRQCTRLQLRIQQRWQLRTSVINDHAVEVAMKQHTWQHGERSQPDEGGPLHSVHRTRDWIPPIVVRSAGCKGYGAFAARQLRALEVIGEYSGEIVRPELSEEECMYTFDLYCGGLVVDAARRGNTTRFINHARPPRSNVIAIIAVANGVRKVMLRASCDIGSGKELLLDYSYERDGWIGT